MSTAIPVVAGVIRDDDGRVLLSRRKPGSDGAGLWEFPGGKINPGETPDTALERELREELGITVGSSDPLIDNVCHYSGHSIHLWSRTVNTWSGAVSGLEGQEISWWDEREIYPGLLTAADHSSLSALQLPDQYLITGLHQNLKDFTRRLERALQNGLKLIQLRMPSTTAAQLDSRIKIARDTCRSFAARLTLNGSSELVEQYQLDGLHLNSKQLMALKARPLASDYLVSASCHSLEELGQASKLELDFVSLSPVAATSSHPGAEFLGIEEFGNLVRGYPLPVFALGGMQIQNIAAVRQAGGQGIAGISAFW